MFQNKDKDQLLTELNQLGLHPSGRKIRSDKGKPHTPSRQPRSDQGQNRQDYTTSGSAHNKRVFQTFLLSHSGPSGDDLIRDTNMIFPPHITSYFKIVKSRLGQTYSSSVKRQNHPEQLRWRWWFSELQSANNQTDKDYWTKHICDWYFIYQYDLSFWTYSEWAYAYHTQIAGHPNRTPHDRIMLSYTDYLDGLYGIPTYDDKGEVIWSKSR